MTKKERSILSPGGAPGRVVMSTSIGSASGRPRLQAVPQLRRSRLRLLRPLRHAIARVLFRRAVFCAGKRIASISRTGLLFQEPVDRLCILWESQQVLTKERQRRKCVVRTFSSSSFFSERCFRRLFASERNLGLVQLLFWRDVSSNVPMAGQKCR
jgi:hypothetical protein